MNPHRRIQSPASCQLDDLPIVLRPGEHDGRFIKSPWVTASVQVSRLVRLKPSRSTCPQRSPLLPTAAREYSVAAHHVDGPDEPGGSRTPNVRVKSPLLYPLSYRPQLARCLTFRAKSGSRTHTVSMAPRHSTVKLSSRSNSCLYEVSITPQPRVGARGIEPLTSASQTQCAAGLHHTPMVSRR